MTCPECGGDERLSVIATHRDAEGNLERVVNTYECENGHERREEEE